MLGAALVLGFAAAVASPAWVPYELLLWYGAVVLGLISVVNAAHIVSSWHIFYRNPVLRELMGRRMWIELLALPALYVPLFVLAAVKAYDAFPASRFVLFLLVFDGPVFAHHVASQDKGYLSLLSADAAGGSRPRWVRSVYYPLLLLTFAVIFSRSLLVDQEPGRALLAGLPFEPLLLAACGLGAAVSFAAAWRLRREASAIELLYFASIGAWCLANFVAPFRQSLPLLLLLLHSARHAALYVLLTARYFRGREALPGFWLPTLAAALPLGGVLFLVYLGLPGFWPALRAAWAPEWAEAAYPVLMGLVGALLLHHYHIERYSWRFSNRRLGEDLRARLLGGD